MESIFSLFFCNLVFSYSTSWTSFPIVCLFASFSLSSISFYNSSIPTPSSSLYNHKRSLFCNRSAIPAYSINSTAVLSKVSSDMTYWLHRRLSQLPTVLLTAEEFDHSQVTLTYFCEGTSIESCSKRISPLIFS